MRDRDLLELAAKAAGIEIDWELGFARFARLPKHDKMNPAVGWWNPLANDGDALRLAVKLKIHISGFFDKVTTDTDERSFCENYGADPLAATRRAIVRAAAEIGKASSNAQLPGGLEAV